MTNPLLTRLTRRRKWPSPRTAWVLFGGIVIVGLSLMVVAIALALTDETSEVAAAMTISLIVFSSGVALFSAPISGAVTAAATANDVQGESFQLLQVTNLSPRDIVRAYFLAALFRLRLLWALAFGLLLPLALAVLLAVALIDIAFACFMTDAVQCVPPTMPQALRNAVVPALEAVAAGAVIGVVLNLLAICAALWLAFRVRRPGATSVATLALVILCLAFPGLVSQFYLRDRGLVEALIALAAILAVYVFVSRAFYLQSQRQARLAAAPRVPLIED